MSNGLPDHELTDEEIKAGINYATHLLFEQRRQRIADQDQRRAYRAAVIELAAQMKDTRATHTRDFASVNWFGKRFTFSVNERKIVAILWEEWEKGHEGLSGGYLLEEADCDLKLTIPGIFKDNPAYGTMIQPPKGRGDIYRLVEPS